MKRKGHDHKESFSILFISHAGQKNRQINISQTASRVILFLLIFVLLVLFGSAGVLGWMIYQGGLPGSGQNNLRAELNMQTQLVQLKIGKIFIQHAHNEHYRRKKDNECYQTDRMEDFFCHDLSSILYPTPRTVLINSPHAPSLVRRFLTWTSTVLVPPK